MLKSQIKFLCSVDSNWAVPDGTRLKLHCLCRGLAPLVLIVMFVLQGCTQSARPIRFVETQSNGESSRIAVMDDGSKMRDGPYEKKNKYGNTSCAGNYYLGMKHGKWVEYFGCGHILLNFWIDEPMGVIKFVDSAEKPAGEVAVAGNRTSAMSERQIVSIARAWLINNNKIKSDMKITYSVKIFELTDQVIEVGAVDWMGQERWVLIDCESRTVVFYDYSDE